MAQPLPYLRAGDFGGSGVFHQVINWHTAIAAQPGFEILQAHVYIEPQSRFGDLAARNCEQILGGNLHLFPLQVDLIGSLHVLVEDLLGDRRPDTYPRHRVETMPRDGCRSPSWAWRAKCARP